MLLDKWNKFFPKYKELDRQKYADNIVFISILYHIRTETRKLGHGMQTTIDLVQYKNQLPQVRLRSVNNNVLMSILYHTRIKAHKLDHDL